MPKSTGGPGRRSRGEGSVYPTADGRLRGAVVLAHPDGERTVRRYVSGRTRAEVVRRMAELRAAAAGGFPTGETTGEYLARWVEAVRPGLRPSTHREYARHAAVYWAPLARVELARLTPGHVERTMARLRERGLPGGAARPLSAQTVAHARSTLRRALSDAMRDGLVARNAASLARPPRVERREMRALTAAEASALVEATRDDEWGPLFAVALGTGLRAGELAGLRWSDVDLDGRSLVVRRSLARAAGGGWALGEPKTGRSRRTVMLSAVALDGLRRQRERQDGARLAAGPAWTGGDMVFGDALGRPAAPTTPSRAFHAAAAGLGLAGVRLHDLRHTYASLTLAAGVPLKAVSEALGHSSIVVTADVYAHVTPELRREAADALDRALGGAS